MKTLLALLLSFSAQAFEKISPHETHKLLKAEKAVLVDVREEDEVKEGMARPAVWMPLSGIQRKGKSWKRFLEDLPKDREVIVYCAAGGRAEKAGESFEKEGYKVRNLGGFIDWKKAGYATRKGP